MYNRDDNSDNLKQLQQACAKTPQVNDRPLAKWFIVGAAASLIITAIMILFADHLFLPLVFLPFIVPLVLVIVDAVLAIRRKQLVALSLASGILILLGFMRLLTQMFDIRIMSYSEADKFRETLVEFFERFISIPVSFPPQDHYHLEYFYYIAGCSLSLAASVMWVIRKPSSYFGTGAKVVFLLFAVLLFIDARNSDCEFFAYYWILPMYVVAPLLGIIHNIILLRRKEATVPGISIAIICLLSIPLIIAALHIYALYMPTEITPEKLDFYGRWIHFVNTWD